MMFKLLENEYIQFKILGVLLLLMVIVSFLSGYLTGKTNSDMYCMRSFAIASQLRGYCSYANETLTELYANLSGYLLEFNPCMLNQRSSFNLSDYDGSELGD